MKLDIKKKQCILFLIFTFISIFFAFFAYKASKMFFLYGNLTYYIVTLAIFIWLNMLYKNTPKLDIFLKAIKTHKIPILAIFIIMFFYINICPFEYRILADETNLAATSEFLYEHQQAFLTTEQTFVLEKNEIISFWLDNRFLLYPYCLHIIHCILGYSYNNSYYLNIISCFGCLLLFYLLLQKKFGKFLGLVGMLCLSSYPIFVQYSFSAGYDVFNLFIGLLTFYVFCLFVNNKKIENAEFFLYTTYLFALTRYECSVFGFVAVIITFILLHNEEYKKINIKFFLYPFFYIPIAWILQLVYTDRYLQIEPGESKFSFLNFIQNFKKSLSFISGIKPEQGTVFIIFIFSILSCCIFIYYFFKNKKYYINYIKNNKYHIIILLIYSLVQTLVKLSYKNGDLNFPLSSRFIIPMLPLIILPVIFLFKNLLINTNNKAMIMIFIFFILLYHWSYIPKNWSSKNTIGYRRLKTMKNFLERQCKNKKDYLVISNSPNYLTPFNYSSISIKTFLDNKNEIEDNFIRKKSWKHALVMQTIIDGEYETTEEANLNKHVKLRLLYEKNIDPDAYIRFSSIDFIK